MRDSYVLKREIWLPQRREIVFDFFRSAANLQQITPPYLDFRILTPLPIEMKEGATIDYRLKLNGVPFRWRTAIIDWQPNESFVDTQIRGPYKKWVHLHCFHDENGGTRMTDRVEYKVPGGPLSPVIHRLFVRQKVENIFNYRQQVIRKLFGSPAPVTTS